MGTQSSYGGPGDKPPLLPDWALQELLRRLLSKAKKRLRRNQTIPNNLLRKNHRRQLRPFPQVRHVFGKQRKQDLESVAAVVAIERSYTGRRCAVM